MSALAVITETVVSLLWKIVAPGPDGSPAVFDYAPMPESYDEDAEEDTQQILKLSQRKIPA